MKAAKLTKKKEETESERAARKAEEKRKRDEEEVGKANIINGVHAPSKKYLR